jgi:hypothetical protein
MKSKCKLYPMALAITLVTLILISLFLASFTVLGRASRGAAVQAPFQRSTDGTIVLGGGYFDKENTVNPHIKRNGGGGLFSE